MLQNEVLKETIWLGLIRSLLDFTISLVFYCNLLNYLVD